MLLRVVLLGATLGALCSFAFGQQSKVINIPAPHTSPASGKEMFDAYCAACHGKAGKGDGPVAPALKVPPADLTLLARQNKGKFPALRVARAITGEAGVSAHGSKEMPVWGPVFMSMSHQHESVVHLRVANLTDYVRSLQQK